MRKLYFAFIGFLLTLSLSIFAFAQGTSSGQDGMESALSGVTNINDLLNNPERLERYYTEVNNYFQGKIDHNVFNIIVEQMKILARENPEFGARLLKENAGVQSYAVVSDVKTYGRNLNLTAWNTLSSSFFGRNTTLPDDTESKLAQISKEISDFEKSLAGNKKDQGIKRGEFYKNLKETHSEFAKKVVSAIYNTDPLITNLKSSNDPDLVLYAIDTVLKDRLASKGYPANTLSLLSAAIPRVADLLSNDSVFPIATARNKRGVEVPVEPMSSTTYKFDTFKRPLHAVWKGIWLGECVGGGNDKPTPRRWATVAMNNVNNYAVEKNGSFIGFIQELGMQKKGSPRMVYATEFGTPNLKEDILVLDPKTKSPQKIKMIDAWIEKAPKNIVRVKSDSSAINNAGVINSLTASQNWNNRRSRGDASEFEFADQKLADFIIGTSKKHAMHPSYSYGDGIISDGSVPGANRLTAIKNTKWTDRRFNSIVFSPEATSQDVLEMLNRNPEFLERMGVDEFMNRYYAVNVAKDPVKVFHMAQNLYQKNPDRLKEVNARLLATAQGSADKLLLQETFAGMSSSKTVAYSKTLPWTGEEIIRYLSKKTISYYNTSKEQASYLSKLALKNKMTVVYPAIARLGWGIFQGAADRKMIIGAISELGPEHTETAKESLKNLFVNIKTASASNQEEVFDLALKYGLLPELRAEAPKTSYGESAFSFVGKWSSSISAKFVDEMLKSAIADGDTEFLKLALESNLQMSGSTEKKKHMGNLVSYIVQSKSPKLIALLADEKVIEGWSRYMDASYVRYLPAEAAAYYKLATENRFAQIGARQLATKIASIQVTEVAKETKVVPPAKRAAPVKAADPVVAAAPAPVAAPVAATAAPAALPEGNFSVDLRPLLTELFAAEHAGPVDTAQRRIHAALGEDKYPTRESVVMIRAYLAATTAANLESRAYHVLALFEIAALTPNMPSELYRSSKALATQVLNLEQFRAYQPNYADLLRAQKVDPHAPIMCEAVFPRGA